MKLGKLPATRPTVLKNLEAYTVGPLPRPPATREVPVGAYPVDGNDRYGDCVMAGVAHCLMAWNSEVKESDPVPSEEQVVSEYLKLSPGDLGLNEHSVLNLWYRQGLFGRKIAGYAPVSTSSLLQWHQAIAFYGALFLGISVGQPQQEQFSEGKEWVWVDGQEEEGHCVIGLGYGSHGGIHVATWGSVTVLTPGYLAHAVDEAWVILPHQFVEARKDQLGISLASLQADLARV